MFIAFKLQHWLFEGALTLRYTYVACLVSYYVFPEKEDISRLPKNPVNLLLLLLLLLLIFLIFSLLKIYYYYTIWMSLVTGLFFLVLLLNQR